MSKHFRTVGTGNSERTLVKWGCSQCHKRGEVDVTGDWRLIQYNVPADHQRMSPNCVGMPATGEDAWKKAARRPRSK